MDQLPKELQLVIACYLDVKSKRMLRSTNKKWFSLLRIDNFTIYFVRPSTLPNMVDGLLKYPYNISIRLSKIIRPREYRDLLPELCRLTNLQDLAIDCFDQFSLQEYATVLKKLTALKSLPYTMEGSVLQHFSNLTHLTLDSQSPEEICRIIHQNSQLRSIKYLGATVDISATHPNPKIVTNLEIPNQLRPFPFDLRRFCNLKRLKATINQEDKIFPLRGLTALESFKFHAWTGSLDSLENNTKLTYLNVINIQMEKDESVFSSWTALVNLRTVKMRSVGKTIFIQFLTALTALQNLSIMPLDIDEMKYINSANLTKLEIEMPQAQNCNFLPPFENLQDLRVLDENYTHDFVSPPLHKIGSGEAVSFYDPFLVSTNLTRFSLQLRDVKPDVNFITSLTTLKCLEIICMYNSISIEYPKNFSFGSLTNLQSLTTSLYNDTLVALTNLTRLTLGYFDKSRKEDCNLVALQHMSKLKILALKKMVPEKAFDIIGSLINLEELNVCDISENAMALLTNLTNLKSFSAQNDGCIENSLTKLTNLQRLKLYETAFERPFESDRLEAKLPYLYKLDFFN